ncbi:MAG: hypothetical protein WB392_08025, partial [Methanotrichaceae archaeon]
MPIREEKSQDSGLLRIINSTNPNPTLRLRHTFRAHDSYVNQMVLSPNDKILASSSRDGTIRLWDLESGQMLRKFSHGLPVDCLAWSDDNTILASATNEVIFWNIESGQQIQRIRDNNADILSFSKSPNGDLLILITRDSFILYDLIKKRIISKMQYFGYSKASWGPDNNTVALWGSIPNTIEIFNLESGITSTFILGYRTQKISDRMED